VSEAATDYERKLSELEKGSPFPKFEVLLLGMGPGMTLQDLRITAYHPS
jgi:hypothetical protein